MTPEQRLDRLERIAKLFVTAGLRMRHNLRELDEKFNMLVNMQIQYDEMFSRNEERFSRHEAMHKEWFIRYEESMERNEERFVRNEAIFQERASDYENRFKRNEDRFKRNEVMIASYEAKTAESLARLAESQALTDRKFGELMEILRRDRNGNSSIKNN